MNKKQYQLLLIFPILIALAIVVGVFLGRFLSGSDYATIIYQGKNKPTNKLQEIFLYIEDSYVDSIEAKELEEKSIQLLLQDLDPHSYYIPPEDFGEMNEPLEGNFDGIGVEFRIVEDTVVVISVISGGPSEKVGLMSGDRIIRVDSFDIAGIEITNNDVIKKLKGPRGTEVNVYVYRKSSPKELKFKITRGSIPINSIDASYMVSKKVGYVKISRFAKNTHEEFMVAVNKLLDKKMEHIIIDLRGNGGGVLNAAADIVDEFLKSGKLIVYTEGRSRSKSSYYASGSGILENTRVAILIDENSASASEILAGAIQDNDRGVVLGRRSFGKGLVQEQLVFPDGSAVRLTVARYYTPTGRCIQKSYEEGKKSYRQEAYERFARGEYLSADSIKFIDSLKFYTPKGKVVYGGGGIMPDVFVPLDTSGRSDYLSKLLYGGVFDQFAFDFIDKNKARFKKYKDADEFSDEFYISSEIINEFVAFAENKLVPKDPVGLKFSMSVIKGRIKADMARHLFGSEGFYMIMNKDDKVIDRALKELK